MVLGTINTLSHSFIHWSERSCFKYCFKLLMFTIFGCDSNRFFGAVLISMFIRLTFIDLPFGKHFPFLLYNVRSFSCNRVLQLFNSCINCSLLLTLCKVDPNILDLITSTANGSYDPFVIFTSLTAVMNLERLISCPSNSGTACAISIWYAH